MAPAIPIATYRVQLTPNFDFDAAAAIVPSLCIALHEGPQRVDPWL